MSYDQISNAFRIVGSICVLIALYILAPIVVQVLRESTQEWKKVFRGSGENHKESDALIVDEGGRAVLDAEKLFAKDSVKDQLEALRRANLTGVGE